MSGALEGVRILDLTRLLPGGFCSLLLADLGADVVKVEDTGMGDYLRWAPPAVAGAEDSAKGALFLALNRNKRSIRLNLKTEGGREALRRLARDADVLLESFRPGVLARLGVGYERLREVNRGIVWCAVTGYGQTGPSAGRAGHDMTYLRLNGVLALSGGADGPPGQAPAPIPDPRGCARAGGGGGGPAGPGRSPDRGPGGRRPDGRVRDPGRAAPPRPPGRGPARGRVDVRRRAFVAGHGGGARAARRRAPPPRPRAPDRRRRLLSPVRLRRRLGDPRRPRAEVLARVVYRRRARRPRRRAVRPSRLAHARGRTGDLPDSHAGGMARLQCAARLLRGARAGDRGDTCVRT